MSKSEKRRIRQLAIGLLAREEGLSMQNYEYLRLLLITSDNWDLIRQVRATDDRYYLPEGFIDEVENRPSP